MDRRAFLGAALVALIAKRLPTEPIVNLRLDNVFHANLWDGGRYDAKFINLPRGHYKAAWSVTARQNDWHITDEVIENEYQALSRNLFR